MNEIDIIGKRFGKLTVLEFDHKDKNRKKYYLCKCDCGNTKVINRNNLVTGGSKSCGCTNISRLKQATHKYNKATHPKLYNTWAGMKQRCYNKKSSNYYIYGARGIIICDAWKKSFVNFAEWALSNNYKDGLSIDRIDVNGNYEPSNCRWATNEQQSNNKRSSIIVEYNGENLTIAELSTVLGISYTTAHSRYKRGKYKKVGDCNETNI